MSDFDGSGDCNSDFDSDFGSNFDSDFESDFDTDSEMESSTDSDFEMESAIEGVAEDDEVSDVIDDKEFSQDETFTDKEGRSITTRTWENNDQFMIRAYDKAVQSPPDSPHPGQAGYANLTLERNIDHTVERARLNDIHTSPKYRGSGIGGKMLGTAEDIAHQHEAREVYGNLSYASEDENTVRDFYQNHGYDFRSTANGEEVFKSLTDVDSSFA